MVRHRPDAHRSARDLDPDKVLDAAEIDDLAWAGKALLNGWNQGHAASHQYRIAANVLRFLEGGGSDIFEIVHFIASLTRPPGGPIGLSATPAGALLACRCC